MFYPSQIRPVTISRLRGDERPCWPKLKIWTRDLESFARDSRPPFRQRYHAPNEQYGIAQLPHSEAICFEAWFHRLLLLHFTSTSWKHWNTLHFSTSSSSPRPVLHVKSPSPLEQDRRRPLTWRRRFMNGVVCHRRIDSSTGRGRRTAIVMSSRVTMIR